VRKEGVALLFFWKKKNSLRLFSKGKKEGASLHTADRAAIRVAWDRGERGKDMIVPMRERKGEGGDSI